MRHRTLRGVVWLGVALCLTACESGAKAPKSSTSGAVEGEAGGGQATSATGGAAPQTGGAAEPEVQVPAYEGREGALTLAREMREAAEGGRLQAWLAPRATFPFDVDGKVRVNTAQELDEAMARDVGDVAAQIKPHTTCAAISREELLSGSPWHYLDRLGERPPREELERDLGRMGLVETDWLVNCHADGAAGFFLIVADPEGKGAARIRAFRN